MSVSESIGGKDESKQKSDPPKPASSPVKDTQGPTARFLLAKSRRSVSHLERKAMKSGACSRSNIQLKDRLEKCRSRKISGSSCLNPQTSTEPTSSSELLATDPRCSGLTSQSGTCFTGWNVPIKPEGASSDDETQFDPSIPPTLQEELMTYVEILTGKNAISSAEPTNPVKPSMSTASPEVKSAKFIKKEMLDYTTNETLINSNLSSKCYSKERVTSTTSPMKESRPPENIESLNALWEVCQDEERLKRNIEAANEEIEDLQRQLGQRDRERIQLRENLDEMRVKKRKLLGLKTHESQEPSGKPSYGICESVLDQHITALKSKTVEPALATNKQLSSDDGSIPAVNIEPSTDPSTIQNEAIQIYPSPAPKNQSGVQMTYLGMLETNPALIQQLKKYIQVKQIPVQKQ